MADVVALKKRRAYIKGSMTKMLNFINSADEDTNIEDIKVRLTNIERYRAQFNEIEDKIVSLNNNEELDVDVEDNYYKIVSGLNRKLREKTEPTACCNETIIDTSTAGIHVDVKLPKIIIPTFSGDYTDWQSFHDLFCSTIHDNNKLTPSQKLQYLKGTLKGEAANLLKHFSITDANYIEALKKLRERYDRRKHSVYLFIKKFISQPSLSSPNSVNVRQLLDTSDEILRGLKALGDEAEQRDHWLIYMLINKLDSETNNLWAQASSEYELPSLKQFFDFLLKRVDALESFKCSNKHVQAPRNTAKPSGVRNYAVAYSSETQWCSLCPKEVHKLFECVKFKEMSVYERKKLMKNQHRCFNCLNDNHNVYACKSKFRCRQCNRKHHTLLHDNMPDEREPTATVSNTQIDKQPTVTVYNTQIDKEPTASYNNPIRISKASRVGSALLPTALVRVLDERKQYQMCRILLDSGSQVSLISEKCVQRLQLKRRSAKISISGIGAVTNGYTKGITTLIISPWHRSEPTFQVEALIFPKLTASQPSISSYINVNNLKQYDLADPYFYSGAEIDIILGADMFLEIMADGKVTTDNQLSLQNTVLGWIIAGKASESKIKQINTTNLGISNIELDKSLRRFWELEAIECNRPKLSKEEELCVKCFKDTTTTDHAGRFKVNLPFKLPPKILGESFANAIRRMYAIERKCARNPEFATLYKDFMKEYLAMGHMQEIEEKSPNMTETCYYLPHHGVIKTSSTTTKLRVVFDGSAKTTTGKSLNDCLAVGPTIQSSLYEILIRFRKHKVVFTADIEKMYRQIRIADNHTRYQRIVWREQPNKPFKTYELQTVTYGTASASYLATRSLIEAADKYQDLYPRAAECIKNDMYIDDLMTGAETIAEATQLKEEINIALSKSGFHLRKWLSNETALNDNVEIINLSKSLKIEDSTNNSTKILGLHWNPSRDYFQFRAHLDEKLTTTKRGVLSEASRLFDPVGWLAPITITIKIFFQSLWSHNLNWDDELPQMLLNEWSEIRSNIPKIENIKLSRCINVTSKSIVELHGFSDASKHAYSAVVYAKIFNPNEQPTVKLLAAKTKVAPVKQLSIPRLELCGAVLLSKLVLSIKEALKVEIKAITAWTDSTIVLNWLNSHPSKWNTFVGNRTGDILTHFEPAQWRHIESRDNPADCASRGLKPDILKNFKLWWNGPEWLPDITKWPKPSSTTSVTSEELRIQTLKVQIEHPNIIDDLINTKSSFHVLLRILSYVYRYISIQLRQTPKGSLPPHITNSEIRKAQHIVLRHIQQKYFDLEIRLLKSNKEMPASSKIRYFTPFIDEAGLLRVGGRIQNAVTSYDIKHPILLTAKDKLVETIVRDHHLKYLHAGPSLMMATLRRTYWILGGRNLIRRIVHNCVICTRYNARNLNQIMGQLPHPRVELIMPFHTVGIDYAGPFQTCIIRGRGQKCYKSYACIFVCLATKAAHIELVSNLTTDAFFGALKRFTSRRGLCKEIHCDNATNFIGARNHLHQLFTFIKENHTNISNFLLADQIEFKFIPPSAPHFGGLWEAAVKSIKHHLKRVTNGHTLTIEELTTLLTEIEAVLNSRPLCKLSDDEMDYLTPAHFLIGRPSKQIPNHNLLDVSISRLSRWQLIQQMNQHIWRRWNHEYLTSLQRLNKWQKNHLNVKIGAIVLIKDDNLPPCKWLLGKIIEVHPGKDGKIRVVTIRTTHGIIKRPIHKTSVLPVN